MTDQKLKIDNQPFKEIILSNIDVKNVDKNLLLPYEARVLR